MSKVPDAEWKLIEKSLREILELRKKIYEFRRYKNQDFHDFAQFWGITKNAKSQEEYRECIEKGIDICKAPIRKIIIELATQLETKGAEP